MIRVSRNISEVAYHRAVFLFRSRRFCRRVIEHFRTATRAVGLTLTS